jgi:hypothetical protein
MMTLDEILNILNDESLCPVIYQKHVRYRVTAFSRAYTTLSEDEFKGMLPYLIANEAIRDFEIANQQSKTKLDNVLRTTSASKLERDTLIKKYFNDILKEENKITDKSGSMNN